MRLNQPTVHVVIAGGGVAATQLALDLHAVAGRRVRLTIVARRAGHGAPDALDDLARRVGARLVRGAATQVWPAAHQLLVDHRTISYDALVLATGAERHAALPGALTLHADGSGPRELPDHLFDDDASGVTFVVPCGAWSLPLYERALDTAQAARRAGIEAPPIRVVSHEDTPLALFGAKASASVAALLDRAGIAFTGGTHVGRAHDGRPILLPGGAPLQAQLVVALPTPTGTAPRGVPADAHGFVAVDAHGRVAGLPNVYAAGACTTFPARQADAVRQQAHAVAAVLAAAAGAPVIPVPSRPVLRGHLMTGSGVLRLICESDPSGSPSQTVQAA